MKKNSKSIIVDGIEYREYVEGSELVAPIETDHVIIIAQRGWIFEGLRNKEVTDKIQLLNANVVRKWSNGRGIGGLTKVENKDDYILDPVGTVSFPNEAIIATIDITSW